MPGPAKSDAQTPRIQLGVLNEIFGFRLKRIQNYLQQNNLNQKFAESVTHKVERPGLFSALALIAANPGISQIALATEGGVNEATVVGMLDSLETLQWAERRRAPDDRRRSALYITRGGEKALAQMLERALENEAKVKASLSEAERAELLRLLDKVYTACCT